MIKKTKKILKAYLIDFLIDNNNIIIKNYNHFNQQYKTFKVVL